MRLCTSLYADRSIFLTASIIGIEINIRFWKGDKYETIFKTLHSTDFSNCFLCYWYGIPNRESRNQYDETSEKMGRQLGNR